ncbi:bactofilin family protein [Fulvivirga sediminis]|uniref:Polymer-forming cytoskeletal protein n=1 Tax=Fulvivirga sediminis TaxID=2803949 RepID=A0A937K2F2_9BACT|nr:polymer-forming cytoskeletal protein [Fulvivirga sediminis]MBL3657747.1 polymer-forming cytoskeletal protein [Fulvivirga sediminis]
MFASKEDHKTAELISNSSNIIGKGTVVQGSVETFGNVRIEGKIIGDVKTKSKVALGQSSFVEGSILAQNAEIEGRLDGNIETTEVLILKPTAVVNGDIYTNKLIVETGAVFNGGCKMGITSKEIKIETMNSNGQSTKSLSTEGAQAV